MNDLTGGNKSKKKRVQIQESESESTSKISESSLSSEEEEPKQNVNHPFMRSNTSFAGDALAGKNMFRRKTIGIRSPISFDQSQIPS